VVDHELLGEALLLGAEKGPSEVGLEGGELRQEEPLPEGKLGDPEPLLQKGLQGTRSPRWMRKERETTPNS